MMNGDPSPFVDPIVAEAFEGKLSRPSEAAATA